MRFTRRKSNITKLLLSIFTVARGWAAPPTTPINNAWTEAATPQREVYADFLTGSAAAIPDDVTALPDPVLSIEKLSSMSSDKNCRTVAGQVVIPTSLQNVWDILVCTEKIIALLCFSLFFIVSNVTPT